MKIVKFQITKYLLLSTLVNFSFPNSCDACSWRDLDDLPATREATRTTGFVGAPARRSDPRLYSRGGPASAGTAKAFLQPGKRSSLPRTPMYTALRLRIDDGETAGGFMEDVYVPGDVKKGPTGLGIAVLPPEAPKDFEGNFLEYSAGRRGSIPVERRSFFDHVSSFAVVWSVLNMYDRDVQAVAGATTKDRWRNRSLDVYPHMTEVEYNELDLPRILRRTYEDPKNQGNAFYYQLPNGSRILCSFPAVDGDGYTCKSSDVVAHETGHFVLDLLSPRLLRSTSSDMRAFHECFGDMSAIFFVLSFANIRQKVIDDTHGDLTTPSFVSYVGENVLTGRNERDAADRTDRRFRPSCEPHDLSKRPTRALFGALGKIFNEEKSVRGLPDELERVTNTFRKKFVEAVLNPSWTSLGDFGRLLSGSGTDIYSYFIGISFAEHGIDLDGSPGHPLECTLGGAFIAPAAICSTGTLAAKTRSTTRRGRLMVLPAAAPAPAPRGLREQASEESGCIIL